MTVMTDGIENLKWEFNNAMRDLPAIIQAEFDSPDIDEDDEEAWIQVNLVMEYGNVKKEHSITLYFSVDKWGIDLQTEDADIERITTAAIMTQLYFDLAFDKLDDKYMI